MMKRNEEKFIKGGKTMGKKEYLNPEFDIVSLKQKDVLIASEGKDFNGEDENWEGLSV